jgi:hypothetical protein
MTLHCTTPTRIDLLFTMSNNPQIHVDCDNELRSDVSRTKYVSVRRPAGLPSRSAFRREGWWSLSGSNRRPHACKARALPAELRPHNRKDECEAAGSSRRLADLAEIHVDQSAFALTGDGATAFAYLPACRAEAPIGAKAGGPGKT